MSVPRRHIKPLSRQLCAALTVLALAVPLPAYPLTLPQLLAMPLEELLRLRVAMPARVDRHHRFTAVVLAPDGGKEGL